MPHSRHVELTESEGPTLQDYFGWLRRRWWILAAGALVGLAAAAGFTAIQPRTYTATTSVQVRQIGPDANPNAKVNLDTEAQIIRSTVVATRARALLRAAEPPESLARRVQVTVPPNSQVLHVSFDSPTRAGARDGSRAFTQAYLDLRVDIARRDLDTAIAELRKQIDDTNRQLTQVAGKIASLPPSNVERQRAEADRSVLTNQLGTLNGRLSPLLATALDPGLIISEPSLPARPSSPNRVLNLASGFGAGLLLGIALAMLLDRLDTRVRRGRDIADRLGVPVLLELPGRLPAPVLLPATDRMSRELGRLRNVLLTTVPEPASGGRRMLLAAASPGGATGFLVGNLAAAYARTGAQVAVVTTNPESPLAAMAGNDPGSGLAEVLRRDLPALAALTAVPAVPQLRVLLPGQLDPEAELPVAGLLDVLAELADRFDHVLIETAPPGLAVEAQALASHVDAVLLVAEARRTRTREVTAAIQQFEQVQAPVTGAVLVPHMPPAKAPAAVTRTPARGTHATTERAAASRPSTGRPTPPGRTVLAPTAGDSEETVAVRLPVVHADEAGDAGGPVPTSESTMVLPRMTDRDAWGGEGRPQAGTGRKGSTYRTGATDGTKVSLPQREEQG
ncbi:MAG TPA: Wzz/FepE/Etk N-terminal domain-containing protein [Micromonosporaceae bacterium]|nr:Wzz/FepE/Etk N-terminal domain-containing protein [Micromonosporaceae bacterium]